MSEEWARRAGRKILEDLDDRSGFSMSNVDDDVREEMVSRWAEIIVKEMPWPDVIE